jgi:hypothetical protein
VCIPSGELLFFALGTGEYNELACELLEQKPLAATCMQGPALLATLVLPI